MLRLIILGALAALFFSSTFILNRAMSIQGGHWVWSASLRYFWMLALLGAWLLVSGKKSLILETLALYRRHFLFWTLAGSVGFGVFYALITFSASYAPGWVVAATWQTTILATPIVLLCFGRKVPLKALLLTLIVFAGVLTVNAEQAQNVDIYDLLLGALPVIVAAFAYPLGNQLVWEAYAGSNPRIPNIDHPAIRDSICRVLLLTLGSLPLWIILVIVTSPPAPSQGQIVNTLLVAVFSGVAATTLFLKARHSASSAQELAAADSTQSLEVIFSLIGEVIFLGGALPGILGLDRNLNDHSRPYTLSQGPDRKPDIVAEKANCPRAIQTRSRLLTSMSSPLTTPKVEYGKK